MPEYHDESKLENNKLIINGIVYTVQDLHQLPSELAPYKATLKTNETTIGFQGELSPWSKFHNSPFEMDEMRFKTAEHWIKYTKAKFFLDKTSADAIINSDSAVEAKRLGYRIQGFDAKVWYDKGYNLCMPGIGTKYQQNPTLLNMLRTTAPKLLVESTADKTWGTSIPLKEKEALN